ncbi:MAG: DUF1566 domain-containing protein [Natronospirillum sp.]|uniref:Lcl C-terminal domain-containing protein n=1 Tax=Natronospirillum sp. TaxID=2812955 RepID=UPI0025CBDCBA|nr:DUF1566 domain-containing protein [Natronospirillum sp.]MCH8553250.1 DUF1566 domain-containing protein [Natronospirillum sp.]
MSDFTGTLIFVRHKAKGLEHVKVHYEAPKTMVEHPHLALEWIGKAFAAWAVTTTEFRSYFADLDDRASANDLLAALEAKGEELKDYIAYRSGVRIQHIDTVFFGQVFGIHDVLVDGRTAEEAVVTEYGKRYDDHGDGTVTDLLTGLMWMRPAVGQEWDNGRIHGDPEFMTLEAAQAAAAAFTFAGHSDWRVPSIDELESLESLVSGPPGIDDTIFSGLDAGFVSSSLSYPDQDEVLGISPERDVRWTRSPVDSVHHVRLVRGQAWAPRVRPFVPDVPF